MVPFVGVSRSYQREVRSRFIFMKLLDEIPRLSGFIKILVSVSRAFDWLIVSQ